MASGRAYRIDNWQGGLDYRDGGRFVAETNTLPDEHKRAGLLREALNVICDENGVLRRREGVITNDLAAVSCNSLFIAKTPPGGVKDGMVSLSKDLIVRASGFPTSGILAFMAGDMIVPPTTITGTLVCNRAVFAEAQQVDGQGPLFALGQTGTIAPGAGVRAQWTGVGGNVFAAWTAKAGPDGLATDYRTTVPFGLYMLYFQSRMIIACDDQLPSTGKNTVWWSDVSSRGGPRVWPLANQNILDPDDGDRITGLAPSNQNLLIFKSNKIYVMYDMDDGSNRTISNDIGCICSRTICTTPEGTMFLDQNAGVCITDGRTVRSVSANVQPAIDLYSDYYGLSNTAATYIHGHYLLSGAISPVTGQAITLDYDLRSGAWWAHTFMGYEFAVKHSEQRDELFMIANGFEVLDPGPELREGPGGGAGFQPIGPLNPGGKIGVFHCFVDGHSTDGSVGTGGVTPPADYTHEIRTRWLDFDAPFLRKRMRRVRLTGRGRLNVDLRKGYSEANPNVLATNGLGSASSSTTAAVLDMPVSQSVSHAFSVRVSGNADPYWALADLTTMITARRD